MWRLEDNIGKWEVGLYAIHSNKRVSQMRPPLAARREPVVV